MRNYRKLIAASAGIVLIAVCIVLFFVWWNDRSPDSDNATDAAAVTGVNDETAGQSAIPAQSGPLSSEYRKIAENDQLILYLKEQNLAIQVEEKASGYVWSSVIEDEQSKDNASWKNFMGSGLSIEYFKKDMPKPTRTSILGEKNKTIRITLARDGFSAEIGFIDLKIALTLNVHLEGSELVVGIPNDSIRETGEITLASVYAYPFLGSTRGGEKPGYMFIPDGSGALIALKDNEGKFKQPYDAKIYGSNEGIESLRRDILTNPPYRTQFPVFGIIHSEREHGLFGVVENGQYNARIVAYPVGVSTNYNWITAQFIARESYLQPTSRNMGGIIVHEKTRNIENMQTRYFFLNGKQADYVGLAKTYRAYLESKGVLSRQTETQGDIPIQLDVLGAETQNGLFAKSIVPMTTTEQLSQMIAELKGGGVLNPIVIYQGWNKGGLSGTNPKKIKYESKLGSSAQFARLVEQMKEQQIPLYFYDDYTTAFESSGRFTPRTDAMKKVDRTLLTTPTHKDVYKAYYYLSASKSAQIVKENEKLYKDKGIDAVAVGNTGSILFSEWNKGKVQSRSYTAEAYKSMMESLRNEGTSVALYSPNDYMLAYTDLVLNVPMQSSQYIYTSKTVPFAQIVLKGYKDYFAPYANFHANAKDELLRMIEYGAFPSYYLTYEASKKLKFTNSDDIYTSAFEDWKEEITATYETMNEALRAVRHAAIEDRMELAPGVVSVAYSNGIDIIVNYNDAAYNESDVSIPGNGFQVIEVKR